MKYPSQTHVFYCDRVNKLFIFTIVGEDTLEWILYTTAWTYIGEL